MAVLIEQENQKAWFSEGLARLDPGPGILELKMAEHPWYTPIDFHGCNENRESVCLDHETRSGMNYSLNC